MSRCGLPHCGRGARDGREAAEGCNARGQGCKGREGGQYSLQGSGRCGCGAPILSYEGGIRGAAVQGRGGAGEGKPTPPRGRPPRRRRRRRSCSHVPHMGTCRSCGQAGCDWYHTWIGKTTGRGGCGVATGGCSAGTRGRRGGEGGKHRAAAKAGAGVAVAAVKCTR